MFWDEIHSKGVNLFQKNVRFNKSIFTLFSKQAKFSVSSNKISFHKI